MYAGSIQSPIIGVVIIRFRPSVVGASQQELGRTWDRFSPGAFWTGIRILLHPKKYIQEVLEMPNDLKGREKEEFLERSSTMAVKKLDSVH